MRFDPAEWLEAEGKLAIRYITILCGEPPPEMHLGAPRMGSSQIKTRSGGYSPKSCPCHRISWDYIARCEAALTACENSRELPRRWPMLTIAPEDDDKFEEEYRNSEAPQEPSALNAKEPISTTFADPEAVQRFLARAKRLLAPSPEKLKEMPTTSKRVH